MIQTPARCRRYISTEFKVHLTSIHPLCISHACDKEVALVVLKWAGSRAIPPAMT